MEITVLKPEQEQQKKEDLLQGVNEEKELVNGSNLSIRLVKDMKPKNLLILNAKQSKACETCTLESFIKSICRFNGKIPRHIVSVDEKYLRHCLEVIYVTASKASSWNSPMNLSSLKMGTLSGMMSAIKTSSYTCDLPKLVTGCPLEAGARKVVTSPGGEWILGSITRSKSTLNILKSPLFHQYRGLDIAINFGKTNLMDPMKSVGSDFVGSPGGSVSSPHKLEKKMLVLGNDTLKSKSAQRRSTSMSSTNLTCSDQSSSSVSGSITTGMLHCTWKAGCPYYVFSIDDQKEAYVANMLKAESPDKKALDCMYMFRAGPGGGKEHEIHDNESDIVGKMRVSTSFTLCPNNSQIRETEFVVFGADENSLGETKTPTQLLKKYKGLSRKVVHAFKMSHSLRERTHLKYRGTSDILENSSWQLGQDSCTLPRPPGVAALSENHFLPNLELAAVIVKDHIHECRQEAETGGWGLKFLKKVESKQTIVAPLDAATSKCCVSDAGDCSTSINILVPAGFHGGPRNRDGGPSTLTERWRSAGRCDCGGWDIGCPLTVLKTRPSQKEALPEIDTQECRSFDLFIEGSSQAAPMMSMVNIHDNLYFIHFRSALSALQSFAIAIAIIHSRSPSLQLNGVRS